MHRVALVFKEAQTKLWDGSRKHQQSMYICHAINRSFFSSELQRKAKSIIHQRLRGWATVEEYLHHEERVPESKLTRKKVQTYRLAWLKELEQEFKGKK